MKKKHHNYGKTLVALLLVAFVSVGISFEGKAQQGGGNLVLVELMKVEPGDDDMYLDVEREIWKPLHQERINQGEIRGWILYRIRFTGANDEYNYATATLFNKAANMENPFSSIDPAKVHPGKDLDYAMKKTMKSRKLVKRQLLALSAFAYPENSNGPAPHKYIQVNYMKVRPASGYLNVARTIWKPILQEYVNVGSRAGWNLWRTVYPRGFGEEYQYVTVDHIPDFSKIGAVNFQEAVKKAHPEKDVNEMMKKSRESREMVRTELWEVVDVILAK